MPKSSDSKSVVAASSNALRPDEGVIIPRITLAEQGFQVLKTRNKRILEETQSAFRYPAFVSTVAEMRNNPTVGSAMNVYRMMMSRVQWDVEEPVGASEVDIARADAVRSMMHDMEGQSWSSFIESVIPYLEYGFSVHEKVLRRRLQRNGSKYNDGLIGIRKLAPRSQDTITGWVFSDDGSELLGVEQDINTMHNAYMFAAKKNIDGRISIDREKFLLFSASATKGNPEGNSIFKNIYLSFKQLTLLQDQELLGVAKDVQGMLKIGIPPRYLDPNASTEDKAAITGFQAIIDNYNSGTQRGLLVPLLADPESKLPMFTYDIMPEKGMARYDTEAIIKRIQGDILSALSVDVTKLGADGGGSFSLASAKTSILALAIDYRLREIAEVLSTDLMRCIFSANGWSLENLPKFVYADIEEIDVGEFSAAIQRIFAVSAVEIDRPILNRIRKVMGVAELPDDMPVQVDKLPAVMTGQATNSGEGMKTAGDGTRKNVISGSGDSSVSNKENKA